MAKRFAPAAVVTAPPTNPFRVNQGKSLVGRTVLKMAQAGLTYEEISAVFDELIGHGQLEATIRGAIASAGFMKSLGYRKPGRRSIKDQAMDDVNDGGPDDVAQFDGARD